MGESYMVFVTNRMRWISKRLRLVRQQWRNLQDGRLICCPDAVKVDVLSLRRDLEDLAGLESQCRGRV